MDEDNRKVIIREIKRWRGSKLLPEQYCDFLLNLYQADEENERTVFGLSSQSIVNLPWKFWFGIAFLISFVMIMMIQFSSFPIYVQVGISACVLLALYVVGAILRTTNQIMSLVCLGTGSLFMLFISVYLLRLHDLADPFWTAIIVLCCGMAWLLVGLILRMPLFQFCGFVGIFLYYGWLANHYVEQFGWIEVQLTWVPLAVIFIVLGWLLSSRTASFGTILMVVGFLLWFTPEGYAFFIDTLISDAVIQISWITKMLFSAVLLFVFRAKWSNRVAL